MLAKDAEIDRAFTKLLKALSEDERRRVLSAQKQWLRQRNQCRDDLACLRDRYTERLDAVVGQWEELSAYKPDEGDLEALSQFRMAIEQNMLTDKEFPLERAIERFSVAKELASIGQRCFNAGDLGERPKNVLEEEWAAFLTLPTYAEAINLGCAEFSWLDVDGDGQRDLLASTFGGNAFFEAVLRRTGKTFNDVDESFKALWSMDDAAEVFAWGCKGCDQESEWVRMNGRVYRAYRNGRFGINEVFLLTPLRINHQAPRIVVKYGHSLKVSVYTPETYPGTREEYESESEQQQRLFAETPQHKKSLQSATTRILDRLNNPLSIRPTEHSSPICPMPRGTPKEDRSMYMQYGETYYAFEAVADFPVWINKQCHIARLLSGYSYSKKDGAFAWLQVRRPDTTTEDSASFSLTGRRFVVSVESGLERFRR